MNCNSVNLSCADHSFSALLPSLCYFRVKPAIFDLLLAVCIAAYLGTMYLAIQASQNSSPSCAPSETWWVAPAVCAGVEHKMNILSCPSACPQNFGFLYGVVRRVTQPKAKAHWGTAPPLWYDLCSSDQRLEPVRIQMLCCAAFFSPHLDLQTMMSHPVLLPEDSFGLPDWFNQESFFPHSPWSLRQLCPLSPPPSSLLKSVWRSCTIDGSSVFLFTVNSASMRSGVATGSYRGNLTLVWTDVSTHPSDPFTYVILSRAIV